MARFLRLAELRRKLHLKLLALGIPRSDLSGKDCLGNDIFMINIRYTIKVVNLLFEVLRHDRLSLGEIGAPALVNVSVGAAL